ncbi:acetyltransferase [Pseudobutyrivibrio xylanivorans]|uniref:Acetyltransferase n=1 Tax=Pseudobutyrivibrio xylanivorans TaxID=185007 RepID=A0A5P6VW75_PSEXY|nr:acetyltransferase [Pseudobutyrivibrio xylanivorans]QFJ56091.1 acetyltransferase [Pseudobutyrivibrio xylanivorans]
MQDLIIVGASGFGREVLGLVETINEINPTWNVLGFIDDNLQALDGFDLEYKILGKISEWQPKDNEQYVLAIAAPKVKEKIVPILKERGAKFATVIHPTATVSRTSAIGEGLVLFRHASISVNCEVDEFVFFNAYAQIGHDVKVGKYSTLCPKSAMAGGTTLGECVFVGTSASTYPGIKIGNGATIGMNSAVIRNVKPGTTVMGVPAKVMV